jgi:hypothetical protein
MGASVDKFQKMLFQLWLGTLIVKLRAGQTHEVLQELEMAQKTIKEEIDNDDDG